jgi:hypothetical protein
MNQPQASLTLSRLALFVTRPCPAIGGSNSGHVNSGAMVTAVPFRPENFRSVCISAGREWPGQFAGIGFTGNRGRDRESTQSTLMLARLRVS